MSHTSMLSNGSFIMTNRVLIHAVGLEGSVFIGELCSQFDYLECLGKVVDGCWFYYVRSEIERRTGISEHKQRSIVEKLKDMKIISTKMMGIPCKMYYRINEKELAECYEKTRKKLIEDIQNSGVEKLDNKTPKNNTTGCERDEQQDVGKSDINNNIYNTKDNNIEGESNSTQSDEKIVYAPKVKMTEIEYQNLIKKFGEKKTSELIENLSLYKQSTGKSYYSDYATIIKWDKEDTKDEKKINKNNNYKVKDTANYDQRSYSPDFFEGFYRNLN